MKYARESTDTRAMACCATNSSTWLNIADILCSGKKNALDSIPNVDVCLRRAKNMHMASTLVARYPELPATTTSGKRYAVTNSPISGRVNLQRDRHRKVL
jgi:hypothetical protein